MTLKEDTRDQFHASGFSPPDALEVRFWNGRRTSARAIFVQSQASKTDFVAVVPVYLTAATVRVTGHLVPWPYLKASALILKMLILVVFP